VGGSASGEAGPKILEFKREQKILSFDWSMWGRAHYRKSKGEKSLNEHLDKNKDRLDSLARCKRKKNGPNGSAESNQSVRGVREQKRSINSVRLWGGQPGETCQTRAKKYKAKRSS